MVMAMPSSAHGWKAAAARTATKAKDNMVDLAQRNPYRAIALAAVAGLLVGMILKRR